MKLLATFQALSTLTASGSDANFPVSNVVDLEPMKRWHADAYTGDVWVKNDFGSAKSLTAVFLNQCNFPACKVQGNDTDVWTSPSFELTCSLVVDDAGNRKGWFDLSAFNYRYLRVLIASGQTLDNSETVPAIGNIIAGTAETMPLVADLTARLVQRSIRFESDGGAVDKEKYGRARHLITINIGDSLANVRGMSKRWDIGVVFADLANAGEAWLVFPPDDWNRPIRSVLDAGLQFVMEEKP